MEKLGMITIGQAPRRDVAPIIEKHLNGRAELIQVGVLDGLTKKQIEDTLYPSSDDYVLTTRLVNGEPVIISRNKIQPILQEKIQNLEEMGIKQILLLCTGVFSGLKTKKSFLIEPDRILPTTIKAMVGDRRLGVIGPLAEQKDNLKLKFVPLGLNPSFCAVSPYQNDIENYRMASNELKDKVDVILLDCMGYNEKAKELVREITGVPVILSNSLIAKLISEMLYEG